MMGMMLPKHILFEAQGKAATGMNNHREKEEHWNRISRGFFEIIRNFAKVPFSAFG